MSTSANSIDRNGTATERAVPDGDDTAAPEHRSHKLPGPAGPVARLAPLIVIGFGVAASLAWSLFLVWAALSAVRWLVDP